MISRVRRAVRRGFRGVARRIGGDKAVRRRVFEQIYEKNLWGQEETSRFFSGAGSRGEAAVSYSETLGELLVSHRSELGRPITIVDLGCGDFHVGEALLQKLPGSTYIGCDIVPALIAHNSARFGNERVSFRLLDIVRDELPRGDVCLVRQVFQHLPNADIQACLKKLDYTFVYVTEGQPERRVGTPNPDAAGNAKMRSDCRTGVGRGVELDQPPFNLRTREVLRTSSTLREVIVTERIYPGSGATGPARA